MNSNPYEPPRTGGDRRRGPVKVKAYGLLPMTRTTYLTIQVVMALACVVALIAVRPLVAAPGHPLGFVHDYTLIIIVVVLALECVETLVMLAKFGKAERERATKEEA